MKLNPVSRFIIRNAGVVAVVGTLLGLAGIYFSTLLYKNLRTDIEELLPSDARSGKDLSVLTERLEAIDSLAVLVFSKDTKASKRFVDDLVPKLEALPKDVVASVEYRVAKEMEYFQRRLGLFLDREDLLQVKDYIRDKIKFEKEMYNPFNIFPVTDRLKEPKLDFDALRAKYGGTSSYESYPEGYYATADSAKRILLVYMAGKHSNIHVAHELHAGVQKAIDGLNPKSYAPDMEIHYTGGVQNLIEEHSALIADLELSTIVVVVLVSLAMLFFYRDLVATASLVISLFMGTLWTFAASYFAVGYLNANSAFLGSIVIGNGINFGVILLARYVEERRNGLRNLRAIDVAMRATATATLTAALAAGLSYGSLILTQFRGFRQFGIIGLIGMLLCWVSSFTLLPAYLVLFDKKRIKPRGIESAPRTSFLIDAIARFVEGWPKPIVIGSAAALVLALLTLPRLNHGIIETDLNKLRNKESLEKGSGFYDRYQIEIFKRYLTPIVILNDNRDDARAVAAKLKEIKKAQGKESSIANVMVLDDYTPKDQVAKIAILKDIKKTMTPDVVKNMEGKEKKWVEEYLTDEAMKTFTEADLPQLLRTKFSEKDGVLGRMVYVEPPLERVAWEGGPLIEFINLLRKTADSVRPGTPVAGQLPISADMLYSITNDGPRATLFAFLAVVVLIVVLFRHVKTIAICLFALLLGVAWLFGFILGFKLKINFLNFIALPITFGIGVDYGVNIFQRYRIEGNRNIIKVIRQTGGAVLLASLTTIIGYSSLLIAANQAFVSFGRLAVLGELTCVTAAVISLPAFLRFLDLRNAKKAPAPTSQAAATASTGH